MCPTEIELDMQERTTPRKGLYSTLQTRKLLKLASGIVSSKNKCAIREKELLLTHWPQRNCQVMSLSISRTLTKLYRDIFFLYFSFSPYLIAPLAMC